jgi:hypothetical protein
LEIPCGVKEFVESDGLERSLRIELVEERLVKRGECLLFVVADDEVAGREAVADGVLGDARFARGSARSGGELCVGAISGSLPCPMKFTLRKMVTGKVA